MKLDVTRASVSAGDDADAPHRTRFDFPGIGDIASAIERVVAAGYLARIAGGEATWSVASGATLAVIAQQWPAVRMLPGASLDTSRHDTVRLHFSYHGQRDPQVVHDVLGDIRSTAR